MLCFSRFTLVASLDPVRTLHKSLKFHNLPTDMVSWRTTFLRAKGQSFLTKRWFIYKDEKPTGPYSALEIRQLLREGVVDPFDFVSQDGSQVKLELVEVDEIFSNDNISYNTPQSAAVVNEGFVPQIADRSYSERPKSNAFEQDAQAGGLTAARTSPPPTLALASDLRKIGNSGNLPVPISQAYAAGKKKKRDPKRYHLIDPKGRVLGPLSPGEIQSLYYRGVVDKNVKVMRDGSNSAVAIAKFVSAYAEAQGMPKTPRQGGHPNIQGVSNSALNRLALMRRAEAVPGRVKSGLTPLAIVIIIISILLIALAIGLIVYNGSLLPTTEPQKTYSDKSSQQKNKVKNKAIQQKSSPKNIKKQPEIGSGTLARPPSKVKPASERRIQPRIRSQPGGSRLTPRAKQKQRQTVVKQPLMRPPVVYRPPVKPVVNTVVKPAAQLPVKSTVTPQPTVAMAPPKAGGQTVGTLVDGQAVSGLGPMQFDRAAVKACDGACTITFTGAGGSVSVAFFKNVWGSALMSKKGGVYISGLVRKNGASTKVLLSGVK